MKKENQLAVLTDFQQMLINDMGLGNEEADKDSTAVPYLMLLQALSPIVAEAADHGNDEIRAGMFYNTSTQEVFKDFNFIPCHFQRRYTLWWDDTQTFGGSFLPSDVETNSLPNGNVDRDGYEFIFTNSEDGRTGKLVDSRMHFVLYHSPQSGNWEPAIISLSKTQIKHSKKLVTMTKTVEFKIGDRRINPPSWAMVYNATISREKNDKGQWYGWNFSRVSPLEDPDLYMRARAMHDSVVQGEVKTEPPVTAQPAEGVSETTNDFNSDDMPF